MLLLRLPPPVWPLLMLSAMAMGPVQAQTPHRPIPSGVMRDTVGLTRNARTLGKAALRPPLAPAAQDSSRECRSTSGYVWSGAFIGFLFGSARYEKGMEHGDGDFFPWLTMPLVIGPYVLGGMLLGHLMAPC